LNGSFENDTVTLGFIKYWQVLNSPDYFNVNRPFNSGYQVPNNQFGSSYAKYGDAYVGIGTFDSLNLNYHEYFYQTFAQPLISDSTYCLSFYIKRAANTECATGNLGVLFSSQVPLLFQNTMVTDSPQVLFPQIITDTSNWVHLSARYKANGTEQYITFGNFTVDWEVPLQYIKPVNYIFGSQPIAYYFFDSISMYLCDALPPIPPPTDTTTR